MRLQLTTRPSVARLSDAWVGSFEAMASPCQILIDTSDAQLANRALSLAANEARRIELKFSRYREDSVLGRIHASRGRTIEVDDETAKLLDFADQCHRLSEGKFDITSGVLRQLWHFDGSDRVPTSAEVAAILPFIGWEKVTWQRPRLLLPPEMEIDLGGIGKEYAVDRAVDLLSRESDAPMLVNFGGDLRATGARRDGSPWRVGIESPSTPGRASLKVDLRRGALATSGDSQRFLLRDGRRYSHVLNTQTGWPVDDAPRSVTVEADTCVEAGMSATLAMLEGAGAEPFLERLGARSWCVR